MLKLTEQARCFIPMVAGLTLGASTYRPGAARLVLTFVVAFVGIALPLLPMPRRAKTWTACFFAIAVGVLVAGFFVSKFWLLHLVAPSAAIVALVLALRAWVVPPVVRKAPVSSALVAGDESLRGDLRNTVLIKNEIATVVGQIQSHIGRSEHWAPIDDSNWVAHRNSFASIPGGSVAFTADSVAWDGFHRLSGRLDRGELLSSNWLLGLAQKGQEAVDALGALEREIEGRAAIRTPRRRHGPASFSVGRSPAPSRDQSGRVLCG